MSATKTTTWKIEPHTKAKHEILRRYLGAWFGILGTKTPRIVYIDGFCGPGIYQGGEQGSPIIALSQAKPLAESNPGTEYVFVFIDESNDRVENLMGLINQQSFPKNMQIFSLAGKFEDKISELLSYVEAEGVSLAPTFAFIDPFGFSGVPFNLVSRLLKNPKTEILINIMADSINRFLKHPNHQIQDHIFRLFGTQKVLEMLKNPTTRFEELRDLYQKQLQTVAKFVRFFEMKNKNDRTIYYLFFASNHPLGHKKMKEAFWKVDPQGGYCFSDATNPSQMVLFEDDPSTDVETLLEQRYRGQTITTNEIFDFINDETSFIEVHARTALKRLELDKKIQVEYEKTDGSKRKKGGFAPGTIVSFVL